VNIARMIGMFGEEENMNISEQVKEILESIFSETEEELIDCAVNSLSYCIENYCIENVKQDYEKKLLYAKEKEKKL
jgi:hypothetical protein